MDLHLMTSRISGDMFAKAADIGGLQGKVASLSDALWIGPLDDEHRRLKFWRTLYRFATLDVPDGPLGIPGEDNTDGDGVFAFWRAITALGQREPIDRVVLWTTARVEDAVFLRMACRKIRIGHLPLFEVRVPPRNNVHRIFFTHPEEITTLLAICNELSNTEIANLATEFDVLAQEDAAIREWSNDGEIIGRVISLYDELLLAACTSEWQPVSHVVGHVFGPYNPINPVGDCVLMARLDEMAEQGLIDNDGPMGAFLGRRVRLAALV